ncbi:MAG: hypothetical protein CML29_12430 [Rhizobiales bacterium]|nr:hypothetical protein [Hyphomicrobiales bacterium]MBA70119.1 hypothetical protein [Hyphomicrobiales bacterium]
MTSLPDLAAFTASANRLPPRHLGTRHDRKGNFLPEPGNTVVCHLVDGSPSRDAIVEARRALMELPGAERLAFTPVSSLHMTLFQGVIEFRRRLPYWPDDVPLNAPIEEVTALYLARLDGFSPGAHFRMRVTGITPEGLALEGVADNDRRALAQWRDRLAACFGYRHPDHDDYRFHITFAYLMEWLEDDAAGAWRDGMAQILARLRAEAPVIELAPPAFCTFEDMRHFEEIKPIV